MERCNNPTFLPEYMVCEFAGLNYPQFGPGYGQPDIFLDSRKAPLLITHCRSRSPCPRLPAAP